MFNGIITSTGFITELKVDKSFLGINLKIRNNKNIYENIFKGDSISLNGVCTTIIKIKDEYIYVYISKETLNNTKNLNKINEINLELPLKKNQYISGHILTGHINSIGLITNIKKKSEYNYELTINFNKKIKKYIIYKGSIAIDGVSLTINSVKNNKFTVNIIPYTWNNTIFKNYNLYNFVNLETDILLSMINNIIK